MGENFIIFRAASFLFIGNLSSQCPYVLYIFIPHAYSSSTQRDHIVPCYLHLISCKHTYINIHTYSERYANLKYLSETTILPLIKIQEKKFIEVRKRETKISTFFHTIWGDWSNLNYWNLHINTSSFSCHLPANFLLFFDWSSFTVVRQIYLMKIIFLQIWINCKL